MNYRNVPFLFLIASLFLAVGCSPMIHREYAGCTPCKLSGENTCVEHTYIQLTENQTANAKLAIVEFNEEGQLQNKCLFERTFEVAKHDIFDGKSKPSRPLLIVGFIHGWHHNADIDDGNLESFQKLLIELQAIEEVDGVGHKRQVVGVYAGWPGKVISPVNILSFGSRKKLAEKIGSEGLEQVIKNIHMLRDSLYKNRVVLIGHSFGGAALFTATQEKIKSDLDKKYDRNDFADLTILMNPALEASKFEEIEKLSRQYGKTNFPLLMSFTSESDRALQFAFPIGMMLFNLKNPFGESGKAYGRSDYVSHDLTAADKTKTVARILDKPSFDFAKKTWPNFIGGTGSFELDEFSLTGRREEPLRALVNVKVSRNIIDGHNDIWQDEFAYFLMGLIGMKYEKIKN